MQLEDIVTSLELSKRLENLGVKQVSALYWFSHQSWFETKGLDGWLVLTEIEGDKFLFDHKYSAFTASELIEMLPDNYMLFKQGDKFICKHNFYCINCSGSEHMIVDKRLENTLAMMLIHLIENKVIEV